MTAHLPASKNICVMDDFSHSFVDLTTAFAPLSGQRTSEPVVWLCDCLGLRVDFDFVRGLEQGLSYRGHCQVGVCFGQSKISCTMKAKKTLPKKTLHGTEAVLDAETTLRDQPVEALFRSPQGRPRTALRPHSLAHDPVAVTAAKHVALGALQLRIAQPVPLADQQAFEQNQRVVALRSDPRSFQTTLQDR